MIIKTADQFRTLSLGHTGENEATRIVFNLIPFSTAIPGGHPALLVQRHGDTEAYSGVLTVDGDKAYWDISATETAQAGYGECELQWYVGDTVAKSDRYSFFVAQALEAGAEPPDEPSKRWFEKVESQIGDLSQLTTEAKENLVAAINEAAKTGSGAVDMQVADGYIQYRTDGGAWQNLIAVANLKGEKGEPGEAGSPGQPGDDGYSPSAKVEATEDGATITITDKDGTTTATVKNGEDGHTPSFSSSMGDSGTEIYADDQLIGYVRAGQDGTPGTPGRTPYITSLRSGNVTILKSDGETFARISDGEDGTTPSIGDNGNWYLGTTDTGKPSRGEKGSPGIVTMTQSAFEAAAAAGTLDANTWYGVYPEEA